MDNLSHSKSDFEEIFEDEFKGIDCLIRTVNLSDGIAHALFITIASEEQLNELWIPIANVVALNYQRTLKNEFDQWNLYLFYLVPAVDNISVELRYKIENDTFSSRKIIAEQGVSIDRLIESFIENKLTIEEKAEKQEESEFQYNKIIWEVIKDKKIKKINVLEKGQMQAYEELLEKLKEQL
jgi:putative protein kinase ArgK-like GTPase of G3E family